MEIIYFPPPDEAAQPGAMFIPTDQATIEYAKRAGQAVLQYREYQAKQSDANQEKAQSETKIARIKDHVFNQKHILDDALRPFDADPDIANAWHRLENGSFTSKDLELLEHEYFESRFERLFKTNYRTSHDPANHSGRKSGLE